MKGDDFEVYTIDLFPSDRFVLCETPPRPVEDPRTKKDRYIEANLRPDLRFKDKQSGKEFWVECKFRTYIRDKKKVQILNEKQFNRFKEIKRLNPEIPIFIVLGLTGTPIEPRKMFLFDFDELKYPDLTWPKVYNNKRAPDKQFIYENGKLS